MKTKIKLTIGVGALFLMIIVLATLGGWYINQLKKDIGNILEANYNSIHYARNMQMSLENIEIDSTSLKLFEGNMVQQQSNATEPGEQEATDLLVTHFQLLATNPSDALLKSQIRHDLNTIMGLNMDAIVRKSSIAENSAHDATVAISVAGALCFLMAFVLLVNLPSSIAGPISKLTVAIREIANNNYKERIHLEGRSEFKGLADDFNSMAEKLSEYADSNLDKILKSKKRIETLVENLTDPVIGIDENGMVIFINSEALKVSGLQSEQVLNKSISTVALGNDLIRDIFRESLLGHQKEKDDQVLKIYANGKESYFKREVIRMHAIPTGEKNNQYIGEVILLRNVTPYKELDLAKTNFVGTISHEFKTPIASIQLGARLLENSATGMLNQEQLTLVEGIKEDSIRLLEITGQLLNISQVESGSIQINVHQVEVMPMIEYAINATHTAAEQKQLKVNIDIQDGVKTVLADSEKTAWVLTNFLSNAIRYSNEQSTIKITVKEVEGMLRFSIADQGPGIEPKYLGRIFERYFRVPGSKKGGTGLGLSIAKEFIEAQGGTISVISEYGNGSCFYFDLKLV